MFGVAVCALVFFAAIPFNRSMIHLELYTKAPVTSCLVSGITGRTLLCTVPDNLDLSDQSYIPPLEMLYKQPIRTQNALRTSTA